MRVIPIYDRILVRVIDARTTRSGLYVPQVAHDNSPMGRGEVIAAGSGRVAFDGRVFPLTVKKGDVVWYSKPAAQAVPFDDAPPGSVVILRENDIIAIVTELDRDPAQLSDSEARAQMIEMV